jgi:hypothetical protein
MKAMLLFLGLGCLLLAGCQTEEKKVEGIQADGKISSIIRNPISADGKIDTVNVARLEFSEPDFDFGIVDEGDVVQHVFTFTNTGKIPLLISHAKSTCGCTVPEWPEEPIEPGESGEITVEFNTKNKKNKQVKPVTITANTYPADTKVYLRGFVNPADAVE